MVDNGKFIVFCEKIKRSSNYVVYFAFNTQLTDMIRGLDKKLRTWNVEKKVWTISPLGLYSIILEFRKSDKIFFNFMGEENKKIFLDLVKAEQLNNQKEIDDLAKQLDKNNNSIKLKEEYEINYKKYEPLLLSKLKEGVSLYRHQVVAAFFLDYVGNALLSLEMGLGKTLCSIAYAEMKEFEKVVVITPNSLKYNFFNEVLKFTNAKAYIVGSKKNIHEISEAKYIIFNYEFFNPEDHKKVKAKLKRLGLDKLKIDCMICDESHRLKNTDSNTFKNVKKLYNKIKSKVFLSGTPAPNKVSELYSVLNQISPLEFATKASFNEYYCGIKYDVQSGEWIQTPPKLEELFHKLSGHTYRKRKIDVLDLPEKTYQKVLIEMNDKEASNYSEIERGVVDNLMFGIIHQTKVNPLTVMGQLRQYTSKIKIKSIAEIIERILEEDEKVVVVDMYKESLYELHKLFPDVSSIHTGDQSVDERNDIVNDFQNPNGKCKVFLGSIQTCNYGLTLTASNKLLIITLPFSVGEYDQVSDRLHRIGQINNVTIYLMLSKDTIDEDVFFLIESKRTEIVKAIDNIDYQSDVSESVIGDLMSSLKKKYVQ